MPFTTDYRDTFIGVAPDIRTEAAIVPPDPSSSAGLQYALLSASPYGWTSDDLLVEVLVRRKGIAEADRGAARMAYFAKHQGCMRTSPLTKRYGWGIHFDHRGRMAMYCMDGPEYAALAARDDLRQLLALRSTRKA
jgi:hypothetical protein